LFWLVAKAKFQSSYKKEEEILKEKYYVENINFSCGRVHFAVERNDSGGG